MSGPEHYRAAEDLLETAVDGGNVDTEYEDRLTARAQVHATLALAAATAGLDAIEGPNGGSATGRGVDDAIGWNRVIGGGTDG